MFTVADIRDIAIQIERNGEKSYREAAENAASPEIAEMFNWMADEEKRHAQWFETIQSEAALTEEQQELEKMGRRLLQDMVEGQTFSLEQGELVKATSFQEMISCSKGFEKDTILFYEFLKGLISDDSAVQQLEAIIAEEQNHFERLEELELTGNGTFVAA